MWSWETVSLRIKEPKLSFKNLFLNEIPLSLFKNSLFKIKYLRQLYDSFILIVNLSCCERNNVIGIAVNCDVVFVFKIFTHEDIALKT